MGAYKDYVQHTSELFHKKMGMLVLGRKNFLYLLGPSRWTKNQIDLRQIKRKKSNLIAYVQGIHIDIKILKTFRLI